MVELFHSRLIGNEDGVIAAPFPLCGNGLSKKVARKTGEKKNRCYSPFMLGYFIAEKVATHSLTTLCRMLFLFVVFFFIQSLS